MANRFPRQEGGLASLRSHLLGAGWPTPVRNRHDDTHHQLSSPAQLHSIDNTAEVLDGWQSPLNDHFASSSSNQ